MRGSENVIAAVSSIVSQMTPVVTITANVADGSNWRLSTCNTYWITTGMILTIGGESFRVESFVEDSYIVVSGDAQPVGTWFQLSAPEFWHGTHRKVDAERKNKQDVRNWIVYLPIPDVLELGDEDSEYSYEANIRPLFLTGYDQRYDNIAQQQSLYINPANKMADYYLDVLEDNNNSFEYPEDITRKEWPNFGDPTIWGNDKLIFNQRLSGVELRHRLQVFYGVECECAVDSVENCAPANIYINGNLEDTVNSGDDFDLTIVDTDGNEVLDSYDPNTNTAVVPAAGGGGGSFTYDLYLDGVDTGQDVVVDGTNITINIS